MITLIINGAEGSSTTLKALSISSENAVIVIIRHINVTIAIIMRTATITRRRETVTLVIVPILLMSWYFCDNTDNNEIVTRKKTLVMFMPKCGSFINEIAVAAIMASGNELSLLDIDSVANTNANAINKSATVNSAYIYFPPNLVFKYTTIEIVYFLLVLEATLKCAD